MKYSPFRAFTLVELIVVITIVGILSTVGFVSYTGYLTGARDSNRFSQMTKLSDSLQVYAATKSLPLPDDYIEITASGSANTIAYQGYVGTDVLETIDYTNGGRDPKDDSFFTYMLSRDRKALQLMAFMEESVTYTPQISTSYAVDYENRYPVTYGQKLGILTDNENTPVQELSSITGSLDISNTSLNLKSFLTADEYVEGTGTAFSNLGNLISQKGKFWKVRNNTFTVKCEYADDIVIGDYSLSPCDLGAEYVGEPGLVFQWGENIAWDGNDGTTSSNNCTWDRNIQACTSSGVSSWPTVVSDDIVAGSERWYDWSLDSNRGPCPKDYFVPTINQWSDIVTMGGWGSDVVIMKADLKIPKEGFFRNYTNGFPHTTIKQYWSSSASTSGYGNIYATLLTILQTQIRTSLNYQRTGALPIRCVKNLIE